MELSQHLVRQFHESFRVPVADRPTLLSRNRLLLRMTLILEEVNELMQAENRSDLCRIADALGDIMVVVLGTAVEHGIDMEPILQAIHRSNMSKLDEHGKPITRPDGKILKGPNFREPEIEKELEFQSMA